MAYQHAQRRPRRGILASLGVLAFLCSALSCLHADQAFDYDVEFLRKLGGLELNDYAQMQIDQMSKNYPGEKDTLNLEKARLYYNIGRGKDADQALAAIPASSAIANDAVLLKAEVAAARKRFTDADAAYKQFFSRVKEAPTRKADAEQFRRAVMIYSAVLRELGRGKEAAAILEKLAGLGDGDDHRQMDFLKLQAILDSEASKQKEGRAINRDAIQKALTAFRDLQFVRDGVGASSYLQAARAQILLGNDRANQLMREKKTAEVAKISNYLEAIKIIRMVDSFLEELEAGMGKKDRSNSPVAEALFYKGLAIQRHAMISHIADKKDQARKQNAGAAKYFETLLSEYPDSRFRNDALVEHEKCARFAESQYGDKIELAGNDGSAEIEIKLEQAEALLNSRNYQGAAPLYLEAVKIGRRSRKLPDVVVRLSLCLAQLDRLEEAEALISHVITTMPREANSAESAYRYGGVLYERARQEKNPAKQADLYERAMWSWDLFVTTDAAHPRAADAAFAIAEHYYKEASLLAKAASEAKNEQQRQEKQLEAIAAYRAAIPKYQRLVEVFSAFDKGVRSYYKLGWIYYFLEENAAAAEAFLSYYEEESAAAYADDRLEAKFRAAERLMYSDNPQDALPHYQEIARLFSPDGVPGKSFNLKSEVALRVREDSAAYLPWAYDLTGEKIRPRMQALREGQDALRAQNRQLQAGSEQARAQLEQLKHEREQLSDSDKAMTLLMEELSLDFPAMARKQLASRAAAADNISEQEKQLQLQELEQDVRKLAADLEKRKKDSLFGDIINMQEKIEELKGADLEQQEQIKTLEKRQAELAEDAAKLDAELHKQQAEIKKVSADISGADKLLNDLEAKKQRVEVIIADLDSKVAAAEDDARLKNELAQANAELEKIGQQQVAAIERHNQIAGEEQRRGLQQLEASHAALTAERNELTQSQEQVQNALILAKLSLELHRSQLAASARRLAMNNACKEALDKPLAERAGYLPAIKEAGDKAAESFQMLKKLSSEKIALQEKNAQASIAAAAESSARNEQAIADYEQDIAPLKSEFDQWKRQAVSAFDDFLKQFPRSSKAPDNLARLGTIHMELGDNDKAAATLGRLAADFPDSNASKMALFNLGRAQMEAGQKEDAAKSFRTLIANAGSVSVVNLSYVADAALNAGIPDVALSACEEILKRGSSQHAEAAQLRGAIKDRAYMRAAEAALQLKKDAQALSYLEKLLRENPRTGYFFDAKFMLAEAKAKIATPDLDGATQDLQEILQYADNPVHSNKALTQLAGLLLQYGDETRKKQALARYQQVVMLADAENPAIRDYLEQAIVASARLFAENDEKERLDDMYARYQRHFAGGQYAAEMARLKR
jgi:TolA-binding protein